MAVSSLHYTMGISSGFKVYILEGQHSPREQDRVWSMPNPRIPIYPIKRKHSPEPPQPLKRACPVKNVCREKVSSSSMNSKPPVKLSPMHSAPTRILNQHLALERVLRRLMPEQRETEPNSDDQPLALVKKIERPCSEKKEVSPAMLQQMRPSVITCVARPKPANTPSMETRRPSLDSDSQSSSRTSSPDIVDEHFQRSLGSCYTHPNAHSPSDNCLSSRPISISVEDHFSKALGTKWLLIRAAADSPSSPENKSRILLR
ncbi:transcription cofactor vestigial-like protein 4 [Bombina bombina]|uniref:transcription cofactor vestigial-like protein 4 n=1 Tax=Bombina bombina TaxID=8345 RepID=UPI00235A6696|nr:transcription cofactor vestigial-like protein 4 [Bombina bombina]